MRLLLILTLFLSVLGLKAQNLTFLVGPEIPIRPNDEYQGLLDSDSTGHTLQIYERSGKGILGEPGRRLILEKYDSNLELLYSYEYGTDKMISLELETVGNGYIWIVMEKIGPYKYSYSMIPIAKDGTEGKKQLLFKREINKAADIPYTHFRIAPDSTSAVFVATFDTNKKRRQTEIYAAVFNDQALMLWDKTFTLRGNQKNYTLVDYQLTNNNELVALTKYYFDKNSREEKRQQKVDGAEYSMQLMKLYPKRAVPEKMQIDLEGTFVNEAAIVIEPNSGEIYCSGLTSNKDRGNINGVFFAKYDNTLNPIVVDQRLFSIQDLIALDKADTDVKIKKGKSGLDNDFGMCNMILMQDGSTIITVEQNYVRTSNNSFGAYPGAGFNNFDRGVRSSTFLNSNDIIAIKVSPTGDIEHINTIAKKQSSLMHNGSLYFNPGLDKLRKMDLFLSHGHMVHDGELYFFYNDHRDNFYDDTKRLKRIEGTSRMESAIVRMADDLSTHIKPLLDEEQNRYILSPTRSKQISDNSYFVTLMHPVGNTRTNSIRVGIMSFGQ